MKWFRMPVSVILDTSFLFELVGRPALLLAVEELIDEPCSFATLDNCVAELQGIASGNKRDAKKASAALEVIKAKKMKVITGYGGTGDDAIKAHCHQHKCIVCTQDTSLRQQLKKEKIRVIALKHHSKPGWA